MLKKCYVEKVRYSIHANRKISQINKSTEKMLHHTMNCKNNHGNAVQTLAAAEENGVECIFASREIRVVYKCVGSMLPTPHLVTTFRLACYFHICNTKRH